MFSSLSRVVQARFEPEPHLRRNANHQRDKCGVRRLSTRQDDATLEPAAAATRSSRESTSGAATGPWHGPPAHPVSR